MLGLGRRRREAAQQRDLAVAHGVAREAGSLRANGLSRWRALEPLADLPITVVADVARPLLTSNRPGEAVLGAQMLDTALSAEPRLPDPLRLELTEQLRQACGPGSPAEVVAAALGTYSMLEPADLVLPRALLRHPAPAVRAQAVTSLCARLSDIPEGDDASARHLVQDRDLAAVRALLEGDPDPDVRTAVSEAIQSVYMAVGLADDRGPAQQVYRWVSPCAQDPLPAVREAVIRIGLAEGVPGVLDLLVTELSAPDVDWRFVATVTSFNALRSKAGALEIGEALVRLSSSDWPVRSAVPDDYPDVDDRRRMLLEALEAAHAAT